jgi:biotin carboxyl carrier protein
VEDDVALEVAKSQLGVEQKQMAVEDAQTAVEDAKIAVDDAKYAVEDAKYAVEYAQLAVENAKHDVEDAQKTLDDANKKLTDAQGKSPEIKAPFAGFITQVNVEGGDEVLNGTVAVQIADPNKFEAGILVSEMDISKVKLDGEASVQVDAMPGLTLPAKVTHISPTATIQSGVVNYKVKVEVASLETAAQEEQIQTTGQGTTAVSSDFQLREGLTVTVSVIVAERQNVLLVPYTAITKEGGQSYVQLVSSTGTTEKQAIKTGITDYQFTEVTEGLSEGEKVIIPQSTKTTTTTQQQPQGGMMPIPGVGGAPPPPGG